MFIYIELHLYCTVLPLSLRAKDAMSVGLKASELMCKLGGVGGTQYG